MKIKNWDDMKVKYPQLREEMSVETERQFVADCFDLYEKEGFAEIFFSPHEQYAEHNGKAFEVLGRCEETDTDLCVLPMWRIKLEDGTIIGAYPEEIITSEQSIDC